MNVGSEYERGGLEGKTPGFVGRGSWKMRDKLSGGGGGESREEENGRLRADGGGEWAL